MISLRLVTPNFFVEHNAKINAAISKMVVQKHLTASMKMTGTEMFMQDSAPCQMSRFVTTWLNEEANVLVLEWIG